MEQLFLAYIFDLSRCLVPECDGVCLTRQREDALWQEYFTAASAQRSVFEPNSKRQKKAPGSLPSNMG